MSATDWISGWEKLIQTGGVSARRNGADNRNAQPRLIQNQSAVEEVTSVVEVSRIAVCTHSPRSPWEVLCNVRC